MDPASNSNQQAPIGSSKPSDPASNRIQQATGSQQATGPHRNRQAINDDHSVTLCFACQQPLVFSHLLGLLRACLGLLGACLTCLAWLGFALPCLALLCLALLGCAWLCLALLGYVWLCLALLGLTLLGFAWLAGQCKINEKPQALYRILETWTGNHGSYSKNTKTNICYTCLQRFVILSMQKMISSNIAAQATGAFAMISKDPIGKPNLRKSTNVHHNTCFTQII